MLLLSFIFVYLLYRADPLIKWVVYLLTQVLVA